MSYVIGLPPFVGQYTGHKGLMLLTSQWWSSKGAECASEFGAYPRNLKKVLGNTLRLSCETVSGTHFHYFSSLVI